MFQAFSDDIINDVYIYGIQRIIAADLHFSNTLLPKCGEWGKNLPQPGTGYTYTTNRAKWNTSKMIFLLNEEVLWLNAGDYFPRMYCIGIVP